MEQQYFKIAIQFVIILASLASTQAIVSNLDTIFIAKRGWLINEYRYDDSTIASPGLIKIVPFRAFLENDQTEMANYKNGVILGKTGAYSLVISSYVLAEEGIRYLITKRWSPLIALVAVSFSVPVPMIFGMIAHDKIEQSVGAYNQSIRSHK